MFQVITSTCQKQPCECDKESDNTQLMAHKLNTKQFYGVSYFLINKTLKNAHKDLVVQPVPPEWSLINKSSTSRWERYLQTKSRNKRTQSEEQNSRFLKYRYLENAEKL